VSKGTYYLRSRQGCSALLDFLWLGIKSGTKLSRVCFISLCFFVVVNAHAKNANTRYTLDIQSTQAKTSIKALSRQTRKSVLYQSKDVKNITTNPIKGDFTLPQALENLFAGTSLTGGLTKSGVITISRLNSNKLVHNNMRNNNKINKSFFTGIATFFGVLAGSQGLAAQEQNTEGDQTQQQAEKEGKVFGVEVITVTARKRVESLQDAPLSITSIQGDQLEEMGIADITGIASVAPNVSFSTSGAVSGSSSNAVVYIRGVGQNDYVPVVDPGVGIYVDDVYMGRTLGSVLDLADVQSVEVVRGPQGTLFGRNTIGGAISITSKDPDSYDNGKVRVVVGDQGRREVFATVAGDLNDDLSGIMTLMSRDRDGTVERVNVPGSDKLGNTNSQGFRTKLIYNPTTDLSFKFIADYIREREESSAEVNAKYVDDRTLPGAWNGTNAFAGFAPSSTSSGCVTGDTTVGTNCYNDSQQLGPYKTGETTLSQNDIDAWGVSLGTTYTVNNDIDVSFIVAHRQLEADIARQVDGTPFNIFENRESFDSEQTSYDFRVNGQNDKLTWVAGAFYYEEESDNQLDFDGVLQGTLYPIHVGGITDNSNYAVYGEGTYAFDEKWSLTLGARYTDEEKNATPNTFAFPGCSIELRPTSPSADCDSTIATIPRRSVNTTGYLIDPAKNTISFDETTWRLSLGYKASEKVNVYGTISTGFKSGGFEWRITNTSFTTPEAQALIAMGNGECGEGNECLPTFDPEKVTTYETGIKVDFSETLRLNTALFFSDYQDMIVAANRGGIATFQTNAAQATIKGLEAEITWVPVDSMLVNLAYGYTDAQYDEISEDAQAAGISLDDKFVFSPKHNASAGVSYMFELESSAYVSTRLDAVYKSSQEFEAANSEYARDEGFTALNAALVYTSPDDTYKVTLGVENLTDRVYKVGGDANNAIGYENVIYSRPRNYYLSLDYEF